MKKLLSMLLAAIMIVSLLGVVSVSASPYTVGAKYYFQDFENYEIGATASANDITGADGISREICNDGDGGSGKAVQLIVKSTSTYNDTRIGGKTVNSVSRIIAADETLVVSGRIKFVSLAKQQSSTGKIGLIGRNFDEANSMSSVTSEIGKWQSFSVPFVKKDGYKDQDVTLNNAYYLSLRVFAPQESVYMLDDLEIKIAKQEGSSLAPVISNAEASIGGNEVNYSYDFTSSGTDESIIKLKDGNKVLGTYSYGDTITVSDEYKSSPELGLEIVPIDSNANVAISNVKVPLNYSSSYLVADFENGENIDVANSSSCITSVTDKGQGAGGSDYALDVSVKNNYATPKFNVALRKGYSYDVSMWIKASQDLLKNQAWVIFTQTPSDPSVTGTKYYEQALTLDETLLASNGWVYAHTVIENFNGKMGGTDVIPIGTMSIRLGDGIVANTTGTSSIDFLVDDITVMPREKYVTEGMDLYTFDVTKPVSSTVYNADGFRTGQATGTVKVPETTVTIAGETLGNYLQVVGSGNYNQILKRDVNIKNGISYDLYFWAKADNDAAIGLAPKVHLTRTYKADDEGGTTKKEESATILSVTDSSGTYTTSSSFGVTDEWRLYKARFRKDAVCSDELLSGLLIYRLSDSSSVTNLNFSMGNFKIVPVTDNINALDGYTNSIATAFKTGNNTYNIDYSSSVPYGDVSNVITRIMLPYKNSHVIRYTAYDWQNEGEIQLSADEIKGAKMLVTAKDRDEGFGDTADISIQVPDDAQLIAVAEFDQPVWGKDMDTLTATVYYNNLSGASTLNALCATYDEYNKLITSDVQSLPLSNGEGQVKLSMDATSESKTARVFLWDENFAPIKSDTTPIIKNEDANFIYVATDGNNEAEGGFNSPVATIEKALEKHVALASAKDTYIVLMQGNHMQSKELNITNAHTTNGKLTITSYDKNDKGVISGGYKVPVFTDANEDGIYEATVNITDFGLTEAPRQLYVNGTKATRARSGILTDFKNTTTYYYEKANLPALETVGHLETTDLSYLTYSKKDDLEFVFYGSWAMARCQVKNVVEGTNSQGQRIAKFIMDEPGWWYLTARRYTSGSVASGGYPPRYVENALELLDEEGEWYLNTGNNTLYYKPRANEDMATAEVILPVIDNYSECLVNIEGTSEANVKNLTFDSVTFAHTTWTRPSTKLGHADIQNNSILGHKDITIDSPPASGALGYGNNPEGAIDLKYTNNVNFENCTFTKLGITGVRLTEGVKNSNITGNEFYDISGSAIAIGLTGVKGVAANTFRNPEEAKKIDSIDFSNNYVHHVATEYNGAAALSVGFPSNSIISHNEIAFIPYTGMHIGWGWEDGFKFPGTNTNETSTNLTLDITNNYIHDLFQGKIYDGGAIYTLGRSGGTAADKNKIEGNFIENIGPGAATIYNDQGSTGYEVYNNVSDTSDSWSDVCVTTGDTRGTSNSCNVNVKSTTKEYNLDWHDNYTTVVKRMLSSGAQNDATSSFEQLNLVKDLKNNATTKAIIDNAGIESEYRNNFRSGLQNMMVINEITLSVGESVNNAPFYITGKDTSYKNNSLQCDVSSSNNSVATATQDKITARAKGEAIITYTVLENGIYRTVTTKVTVE